MRRFLFVALLPLLGCLESANDRLQFRSVSAGSGTTCAQTITGETWCWGSNLNGVFGNGDSTQQDVPFPVPLTAAAPAFDEIHVGWSYACGLTGGAAWCWGMNARGHLGIGTLIGPTECSPGFSCSLVPMPVVGGLTFTRLSAQGFVCGHANTQVYCWGLNQLGPLVDGGVAHGYDAPTPVLMPGAANLTNVVVGGQHACGLVGTAAWCWGHGASGQLGDTTGYSTTPIAVTGGHAFVTLSAGNSHTCGLTAAGAAWCWGSWGGSGKLGSNSMSDQRAPVAVHGGLTFTSLVPANEHTCGLTTSGAAYCWGENVYGQVGDGTTTNRFTPVPVLGGHSFTAITAGGGHSCALTAAGDVYCWGDNHFGKVGNSEFNSAPVTQPVLVRACVLPKHDPLAPWCVSS